MQNCMQTLRSAMAAMPVFFAAAIFTSTGQTTQEDKELYRSRIDSAFWRNDFLIQQDSSARYTAVWVQKAAILGAIMDDADLQERFKQLDLQVEYSKALKQAQKLDKNKEYELAIETHLVSSTIDLTHIALHAMENARLYKSVADAEKAVEHLDLALENYKLTGSSQKMVDKHWAEEGLSWQWLRFYKGVCLRMAKKMVEAENEYLSMIKLGWQEPTLFLETADLQDKSDKREEALKTLALGQDKLPGNAAIACALTKLYIKTDQLKKAQATIKPFDNELGMNAEVAMTKALVYEKKGDLKKADAILKAVYNSDKNEVIIQTTYARYLMRKATNAEKMDAEEFAQQAYTLIDKAIELSPSNEDLKEELASIKFRFPKVKKEEQD